MSANAEKTRQLLGSSADTRRKHAFTKAKMKYFASLPKKSAHNKPRRCESIHRSGPNIEYTFSVFVEEFNSKRFLEFSLRATHYQRCSRKSRQPRFTGVLSVAYPVQTHCISSLRVYKNQLQNDAAFVPWNKWKSDNQLKLYKSIFSSDQSMRERGHS